MILSPVDISDPTAYIRIATFPGVCLGSNVPMADNMYTLGNESTLSVVVHTTCRQPSKYMSSVGDVRSFGKDFRK